MLVSSPDFFDNIDVIEKIDSLEFKQIWSQVDLDTNELKVKTTQLTTDLILNQNPSYLQAKKDIKVDSIEEPNDSNLKNNLLLDEWRIAFDSAMIIEQLSEQFPLEERNYLTSQILRSSLSICRNLARASQEKDMNSSLFVEKINDSCPEIIETQNWIQLALKCGYINAKIAQKLNDGYNKLYNKLVKLLTSHGFFLSFDNC